ncbi:MAG: DUF350 domain-containing protein [Thermoleophilaceae bacterium]|nr:DUF350 domain-containing protein [Thermoleophilaceae bacterium]
MQQYFIDLASGLLYGALGIALMMLGYLMIDLVTPGRLGRILVEERNRDAGVIVSAGLAAVGIIVASAIWHAEGELGEGLAEAAGYGLMGILLMGVAFKVIDLVTPGHLGHLVMGEEHAPVSYSIGAALLAVGAILAAAIS